MDALRLIRRELDGRVPLIGFSGSPWTLACYMIEGGGSANFSKIKAMAFSEPQLLHRLLEVVTDAVIAYLSAQRAAGAQALQVFDTWGGVLAPHHYREFSLRYLQRIAAEFQRGEGAQRTPLILFGKGNAPYLEELAASGAEGVGVDWLVSLDEARRRTGGKRRAAGQPRSGDAVRLARSDPRAKSSARWRATARGRGHVFNLGHGMSPDMNPEHVEGAGRRRARVQRAAAPLTAALRQPRSRDPGGPRSAASTASILSCSSWLVTGLRRKPCMPAASASGSACASARAVSATSASAWPWLRIIRASSKPSSPGRSRSRKARSKREPPVRSAPPAPAARARCRGRATAAGR